MKRIPLTQGKFAKVDDADYGELSRYKWHYHQGYAKRAGYPDGAKRMQIPMHRQILGFPKGLETDHINGDGLDNRRSNIRAVTQRQNQMNSKPRCNTSSRYKGVCWSKQDCMWRAYIKVDGKRVGLGSHATEDAAARAYNKAAKLYFKEFANPNIIRRSKKTP